MEEVIFSDYLRKYRKQNNLSVREVSKYLSENVRPVSSKTIYGWENGVSVPNSEFLMCLCEIYGLSDVLEAFGQDVKKLKAEKPDSSFYFLTPREWELVQAYRDNPEFEKAVRAIYKLD